MILMKKLHLIAISVVILVTVGVGILFLNPQGNKATGQFSKELPKTPIHWHPKLSTYIDGQQQTIPTNIGIGPQYASNPLYDGMMGMTDMHTHDSSGTLHWEVMMHPPTEEELYLGSFFQIWGKNFNGTCIFEYCNSDGKSVKMFVNGKPNYDFDKYMVRDRDDIVIKYE